MYSILGKKKKSTKKNGGGKNRQSSSSEGRALSFTYYTVTFFKLIGAKHLNSQKRFVINTEGIDCLSLSKPSSPSSLSHSWLKPFSFRQAHPLHSHIIHNSSLYPQAPTPPAPEDPCPAVKAGASGVRLDPGRPLYHNEPYVSSSGQNRCRVKPPTKVCRWALHTFDMSNHLYTMPLCQITTLRHKKKDNN